MFREKFNSLVNSHIQYIVDVFFLKGNIQNILFEPLAVAMFAFQYQIGHKLHFYSHSTFPLTFFTTTARCIERKVGRLISHLFGKLLVGKKFTDFIVGFDVGYGVRTA